MEKARDISKSALESSLKGGNVDWPMMKANVKDALASYVYQKTKRHPMILPIIIRTITATEPKPMTALLNFLKNSKKWVLF
jgi:hypothetical protein